MIIKYANDKDIESEDMPNALGRPKKRSIPHPQRRFPPSGEGEVGIV